MVHNGEWVMDKIDRLWAKLEAEFEADKKRPKEYWAKEFEKICARALKPPLGYIVNIVTEPK